MSGRETGFGIDAYAERLAAEVEDRMQMTLEEFFAASGSGAG
jgi:hypothetical protein